MKYKAIRCLHDDRINDGQNVQIDQCLYCTRFEPVHGQCYELLNDLGANVATILDDNQAGYSTMEDYINLNRIEKQIQPKEKAEFDLSRVESRDPSEKDFVDTWGAGLKMDWKLVPKERQKTHINWRQSINDDGSKLMRLASFTGNFTNAGQNLISDKNGSDILQRNKAAMDSYSGQTEYSSKVQTAINDGKSASNITDETMNQIKAGLQNTISKTLNGAALDTVMLSCLAVINNADGASVVRKYQQMAAEISTNNPALVVAAYAFGSKAILGDGKNIRRIDNAGSKSTDTATSGGSSSSSKPKGSSSDKDSTNKNTFKSIDWNKREEWLWVDFADRLAYQMKEVGASESDLAMFCKLCYLYVNVLPLCYKSKYDNELVAFPFTDEELKIQIQYSGYYGEPRDTHTHMGVDLGTSPDHVPFYCVADGTVVDAGQSWDSGNRVILVQHDNGMYSRYMHCETIEVTTGQRVTRYQRLGTTGGWIRGHSPYPDSGNIHLHFELGYGDAMTATTAQDPLSYYPKCQTQYHDFF